MLATLNLVLVHIESVINLSCLLISSLAFFSYLKRRSSSNFIGTLLLFIGTCIYYSAFHSFASVSDCLLEYGIQVGHRNYATSRLSAWFNVFNVLSNYFVYIGGIALAADPESSASSPDSPGQLP
ncbi:hypothetical protein L596_008730 [Steinernema carpocapsae]|uniref:Uncharacterized protein n=1 Tax=Steinernema carpocapsae TaxID=34508 RepID=A0A4U5PEH2_STECR|nr:hypothetical protein L596_008730 [Steinernema carpocapsae]